MNATDQDLLIGLNEKCEKKLVCAVYSKNKIGIAYNYGPAFLFVRSASGELDAFEKQLVANMVYAYNQNKEVAK
ncbi:hypothetical protein SDC9_64121 [bioreactor metagenome]|uniref:Uncharacterized protein n=1 Tax=bioreactor metagenome TaxID=1076179 RepID=A0A644XTW2_9ZZZZ|nr:hypothetical protein [Acidaminococcaceae bacterium]